MKWAARRDLSIHKVRQLTVSQAGQGYTSQLCYSPKSQVISEVPIIFLIDSNFLLFTIPILDRHFISPSSPSMRLLRSLRAAHIRSKQLNEH